MGFTPRGRGGPPGRGGGGRGGGAPRGGRGLYSILEITGSLFGGT